MANPHFPLLFSPLTIRRTTLRNRVVMLPIAPRLTNDGRPCERDLHFYGARADAGTGLIITGGTLADGRMTSRSGALWEAAPAANIPAFRRLVDTVHAAGASIFGQLLHPGREPLSEIAAPLWAPSAVASPTTAVVPHAMTRAEIGSVVDAFVASAANLLEAGYDGIELHGAHGFLLGSFFSPHANRRDDAYGLASDLGLRLPFEIAERIRALGHDDAVVGLRLSADEEIPGGLTPEGARHVARRIGRSGLFDYVSAAVGINGTYVKDMAAAQGVAVPLAAAIRAAAGIPVIVSQRITTPAMAEEILRSGAADLVGMARAHIADAEWAAHARRGTPQRIVPCVGCLQECRTPVGGGVRCIHNPVSGREAQLGPPPPATRRKRVVVVGGGPAGMEVARIAAERGHAVVLFERDDALGGQVHLAANGPTRTEIGRVVDFRAGELARLDVDVRVGTTATPRTVVAERPDAVVVATGATVQPDGADGTHPDVRILTVADVLRPDTGAAADHDRLRGVATAAVIDDGRGSWDSVSAAELLAMRGLRVILITPARHAAAGVPAESVGPTLRRLLHAGVVVRAMCAVDEIRPGTVVVRERDAHPSSRRVPTELAADLVVRTGPRRAQDGLLHALEGRVPELHGAGDCLTPRGIAEAVTEGHRIGRLL